MAHVTDLIKQAYTTDPSGNIALRTTVEGDQNLAGGYILNDQTTTNMMSKGTVYRFDGVDDKVQNSTVTGFTDYPVMLHCKFNPKVMTNRWMVGLYDASESSSYIDVGVNGTNIQCNVRPNGEVDNSMLYAVGDITDSWNTITFVLESATLRKIYYNGLLVATATDSATFPTGIDRISIGAKGDSSPEGSYFEGEISEVMLGNFAPTASEVKDLISGNIPFKWQYGSQTNSVTGTDSDFSGAGNWTPISLAAFDVNSSVAGKAYMLGSGGNDAMLLLTAYTGLTIGKEYYVSLKATLDPLSAGGMASTTLYCGTAITAAGAAAGNSFAFTPALAEGTFTGSFVASSTDFDIGIAATGFSGVAFSIDDVVLLPLGAVALYDQTSISETTWYDKANGNDGSVTGAEVLNDADSIADTFVWHMSPYSFTWDSAAGANPVVASNGVHPTAASGGIIAPVTMPAMLKGKKVTLDQITVYYTTAASGDDFDFSLERSDQDGSVTVDVNVDDIGNGTTGAQSTALLSADVTLSDFAYYVFIDVNNADAAADVKIYDIKFSGHLA